MKIDLNATKWFLGFELPGIDEVTEKIGAQLGAVDSVDDIGAKYQGILVVKVVSCQKHPDADKLSLCLIDDGGVSKDVARNEDGLVEVVCGAPNVREGQTVVWIPPGATVPVSVGKEPFVLEAREIRGKISNGMLASAKELALGDNHAGIMEFESDQPEPGTDFATACSLKGDFVIDIENKMFTHRPDCFGFLGIARELAGIYGQPFKSPDWYVPTPELPAIEADELKLAIRNELPELVPRFSAVVLSNVQVGTSPLWAQDYLSRIGQKSINNIVDYTNFYMLETGQPLHAYDYDKVKALSNEPALVIRNPRPGEKIKLLNGKEIEPRAEAIMIATDKQLIGIGGVMGGSDTEVDENTKNIILECATFDMYSVRRTSMAHGLFTDAVTRFTKGQSPLQNLAVLGKIVAEIRSAAGGKVASQVLDDNHVEAATQERGSVHPPVTLTTDFVNSRLGLRLPPEDMRKLLENVEFNVAADGDNLTVTAPFWRTDIELREDVVEEIGRLYGYDKLPLELPKRDLTPAPQDLLLKLKAQLRQALAKAGGNEVLTYSFVHGDLLSKVGQDKDQAFQIANALSPELQYYRLSLTPSLLERVQPNIKAGYGEFALFELGKSHSKVSLDDGGLPVEFECLGFVFGADAKTVRKAYAGAAFYQAKQYVHEVLKTGRIWRATRFVPFAELDVSDKSHIQQLMQPFEPARSAFICDNKDSIWGVVGEYKASVRQALKLPDFCAGFELDDLARLTHSWPDDYRYQALPRFPKITQDLTLKVAATVTHEALAACLGVALEQAKLPHTKASWQTTEIFQPEDDAEHKHVTFRLTIASYERTLTDGEVSKLLDATAAAAKDKFGAE